MYKARLTAGAPFELMDPAESVGQPPAPKQREWTTITIREDRKAPPPNSVELEIPSFVANDLEELCLFERAWAMQQVNDFRRGPLDHRNLAVRELWNSGFFDSLQGSFEVVLFLEEVVSIKYVLSRYHTGAAHPQPLYRTVNVQRAPCVVLELGDLFNPESDFASRLSEIAIRELLHSDQPDRDWVRHGAAPRVTNFRHFNVLADGLMITFPEYQVGSYAEGPYYVKVLWNEVRDLLNTECRIFDVLMR